ncbi:MAG: LysE family transporter [Verrucomicrobiota bacterium]|nr:LysE family transporter [Verrucomicrobiota bacterium]
MRLYSSTTDAEIAAMNDALQIIGTVALIHAVAVASPGPDLFLVLRNTLLGGKRAGVQTSLGIMVAVTLQLLFCMTGLTILLQRAPLLMQGMQVACGFYLLWLGWQAWHSDADAKPAVETQDTPTRTSINTLSGVSTRFFLSGLIGNLLNPKAILFFFGLFSSVITAQTPLVVKLVCTVEIMVANFIWFALVAIAIDHPRISRIWTQWQSPLLRLTGLVIWCIALCLLWPIVGWCHSLIK